MNKGHHWPFYGLTPAKEHKKEVESGKQGESRNWKFNRQRNHIHNGGNMKTRLIALVIGLAWISTEHN